MKPAWKDKCRGKGNSANHDKQVSDLKCFKTSKRTTSRFRSMSGAVSSPVLVRASDKDLGLIRSNNVAGIIKENPDVIQEAEDIENAIGLQIAADFSDVY